MPVLDDRVQIERHIVDMRIGRDDLTFEFRLDEIDRRTRRRLALHLFGVVSIDEPVDVDADIGAVAVLPAAVNLVVPVRLERRKRAGLLPALEVLHSLQDGKVDAQHAGGDLLVDLVGMHVAGTAADGDGDPRIALHELLRGFLVGRGRAAPDDHERPFPLGRLVKRIRRLCRRASRTESRNYEAGDQSNGDLHLSLPLARLQ